MRTEIAVADMSDVDHVALGFQSHGARVSKRELYALIGNKQKMLIAAIGERAQRFQAPADMPMLRDRATLAQALAAFGTQLVREASDPTVVAVFRLAIAEAVQAPEVARTLDGVARDEPSRVAPHHDPGVRGRIGRWPPGRARPGVRRTVMARFDDQSIARCRRATERPCD